MTACFAAFGALILALVLLFIGVIQVTRRLSQTTYKTDASLTAIGCTAAAQLFIDQLVERHKLKLDDIADAARGAFIAYDKLKETDGWPGNRLEHGTADGQTMLSQMQLYCANLQAAGHDVPTAA